MVGLLALILVASISSAFGQAPEATVLPTAKRLYVAAEDKEVTVEASLPTSCAGTSTTVAMFKRGGGASVNTIDPLFATGNAVVAADGRVRGAVSIPATLPPELREVWPGVLGGCLRSPVVSVAPGLLFGVRDPIQNPGLSSTFVLPLEALFMGEPPQPSKGKFNVTANGKTCTSFDLQDAKLKDSFGNLRFQIGGTIQPSECSTAGAEVNLYYSTGAILYDSRVVAPGVSQPFANLAPKFGPSTGPDPAAPGTGQFPVGQLDPAETGSAMRGIGFALSAAGALAFVIVTVWGRRRRSASVVASRESR